MFVMKRNQIIITALVVMITVAGYLNYTDSKRINDLSIPLTEEGEINPILVDEQVVSVNKDLTNSEVVESDIGIAITPEENGTAQQVDGTAQQVEGTAQQVEGAQTEAPQDVTVEDPGAAIFVNKNLEVAAADADGTYFIQAKMVREQERSKQREILTDMINNNNITTDQKAKYADEMITIQKRIEKESAAEAMIEAKGFKNVYVRIDDSTVDVVVDKAALTDAEISQIEDIVTRKTGMDVTQVRISPMKR